MKTCLVVDDSSVIRKVARRILEDLDFRIVEAEDGEKALEICKHGAAGCRAARLEHAGHGRLRVPGHLRRMPGGDEPKVVFCTTENDVAHISRRCMAAPTNTS